MPIVDVQVTEGVLTPKQRDAIKRAVTKGVNDAYVDILGAHVRPMTWVVVQDAGSRPWSDSAG